MPRPAPGSPQSMREFATAPTSQNPEVTADRAGLISMLRHLWPYIWPADRRDLKGRVLFATALIFAAKLATVVLPFTFKWATDALAGHGTAPVGPDHVIAWVLATPVAMTVAYGGTRILMGVLTQWRDGIFAKVAMHAVRRLAMLTFEHIHLLSLRFHLERKTGGLTRDSRTRTQRHRDDRAHAAVAACFPPSSRWCWSPGCCSFTSTGATSLSSCSPSRSMSALPSTRPSGASASAAR